MRLIQIDFASYHSHSWLVVLFCQSVTDCLISKAKILAWLNQLHAYVAAKRQQSMKPNCKRTQPRPHPSTSAPRSPAIPLISPPRPSPATSMLPKTSSRNSPHSRPYSPKSCPDQSSASSPACSSAVSTAKNRPPSCAASSASRKSVCISSSP